MASHIERRTKIHEKIEAQVAQSRLDLYEHIRKHPEDLTLCMHLVAKYDIVLNENGKMKGYNFNGKGELDEV